MLVSPPQSGGVRMRPHRDTPRQQPVIELVPGADVFVPTLFDDAGGRVDSPARAAAFLFNPSRNRALRGSPDTTYGSLTGIRPSRRRIRPGAACQCGPWMGTLE